MATQIQGRYFGEDGKLFGLYIKTALLTLITLGIYRFWARTRIRKYIWSATSGDKDSFEYTGTGLEKFLGFLVAIVILAIYLGIVQMLLFFFGLNLFVDPGTNVGLQLAQLAAIYITFFAVLPLLLFAQYRARRYKMARSRWRGIRFGMENGAWGYALRAIGYYLLNLVTLGLLTPLVTFRLEKYMADRSWYGDAQFAQGGKWTALYGGMKHFVIGMVILIASFALGVFLESPSLAGIGFAVGYIWAAVGMVYYRVFAMNYLTAHKTLDGRVNFAASLKTGTVVKIVVVGTLIIGLVFAVAMGIIFAVMTSMMSTMQFGGPPIAVLIVLAVLYGGAFLIVGGISLVMITQRVIEHGVNNITVLNADHLDAITQRAADKGADAEGFADALDVGGAI